MTLCKLERMTTYIPDNDDSAVHLRAEIAAGTLRPWRKAADGTQWYVRDLPPIHGVAPYDVPRIEAEDSQTIDLSVLSLDELESLADALHEEFARRRAEQQETDSDDS